MNLNYEKIDKKETNENEEINIDNGYNSNDNNIIAEEIINNKKETNEFLLLTCSLAVYYVLTLIPFIHGLVVFLSLILGLGIFFNAIINLTKTNKE